MMCNAFTYSILSVVCPPPWIVVKLPLPIDRWINTVPITIEMDVKRLRRKLYADMAAAISL